MKEIKLTYPIQSADKEIFLPAGTGVDDELLAELADRGRGEGLRDRCSARARHWLRHLRVHPRLRSITPALSRLSATL